MPAGDLAEDHLVELLRPAGDLMGRRTGGSPQSSEFSIAGLYER